VSARPYELLVFDWDGTLMDSMGSIVACTRATLTEVGLPALPEAAIRQAIGLGLGETIERLAPGTSPAVVERIRECYGRLWVATYRERPLLFAGAGELLAGLEAEGYLLAIATGKSRRGLDRDLAATGLAGRFHATRTADEARSKPDPEMLASLLGELGVRPASALMVGDSRWDLQMAANAGVAALGVATGGYHRDELVACGPAGCVGCLEEVRGWLAGRGGAGALR
jgi:phosphoglycolate phosphatase